MTGCVVCETFAVYSAECCGDHAGPVVLSSGLTAENGRAAGGQCDVRAVLEDIVSGAEGQSDVLAASRA